MPLGELIAWAGVAGGCVLSGLGWLMEMQRRGNRFGRREESLIAARVFDAW